MDRLDMDTVPQKIENDATLPWSRDNSEQVREKKSQEIEKATTKIVDSRDEDNNANNTIELNNTKESSTILKMKPKDSNSKTSIVVEKPKSIEKPKIDGIQLEVIKESSPIGAKKESIVVVTQIKKEGSTPKVIEVVAISKNVDREVEEPMIESEMQEEFIEIDESIVEENGTESPYPSNFIYIQDSH
jgi:lipopolysaccharide export LptBFGC system permease protein LptF